MPARFNLLPAPIAPLLLGSFIVFCYFSLVFFDAKLAFLVNTGWFTGHQVDSDDLVFKRLIYKHFSDSKRPPVGLLRADRDFQIGAFTSLAEYRERYADFPALSLPGNAERYTSQIGLQPLILYPAYWYSFLSSNPDTAKKLYRGAKGAVVIVVVLNALVMTALVLWISRELSSATAAFFALALPTLAPWLVVFGHSVYWMLWSWFVPFLITLWGWRQIALGQARKHMPAVMYAALFLSFVLKMSMGYEYISAISLAASTPVFYYGIRDRWEKIKLLFHIALTGLMSVGAFVVTVLLHAAFLMTTQALTFTDSLSVIYSRFAVRSWEAFVNIEEINHDVVKASLTSGPFGVLWKYFFGGPPPWEIFIMLPTVAVALWYNFSSSRYNDEKAAVRNVYALSFAAAYALLAPLSHFIIMKGHSYIHYHMNYVLWNLPLNIFCLLIIIHCFTSRLSLTVAWRVKSGV